MAAKAALVLHGCTGHGVLQPLNGPVVASATFGVIGVLTVVLDQGVEFGAAGVQNTGKVQGNIG